MKASKIFASLCVAGFLSSCAFLLDFDELQTETGKDASVGGAGSGGVSGASGSSGVGGASASGGASGADGGGIDLGQLAKTTSDAICAKLEQCYGAPAMALIFGDADCNTAMFNGLKNSTFALAAASLQAGKMTLDQTQISSCLKDFQGLACNAVSFDFPEACRKALAGTVAAGKPCAHALECAPGHYCAVTSSCPGKCAPVRTSGQTCSDGDVCAAGLGCTGGKCTALAGVGEPCLGSTGNDCEVGAFCFGNDDAKAQDGNCVGTSGLFSAGPGEACSYWTEAATPATFKLCKNGVCPVFKLFNRVCESYQKDPGFPCSISIPDPCPSGQYCNGTACTDLPSNGQSCAPITTVKGRCKAGHSCNGTTCDVQRDNGQVCGSNAQCFGGACDLGGSNLCVPPGCPVTP